MKILFCIDSLRKGGAERVISNLSNAFIKDNLNISILMISKCKIEYELNPEIELNYLEDEIAKNEGTISKIISFFRRTKLMKKKISYLKPDVIVSFLPYTSFVVLNAIGKKIPVIVSIRNDPETEYSSKLYNLFMRMLYPKAKGIVYQTKEAKNYFKNILNVESEIIPNSINPDFIVDKEFEGKRKKEIVSVGRLFDQKNQKLLIDSFIEIKDKIPDYKLIIYGEGYKRNDLEKIIKDNNMNERIILPGNIKNVREKIYDSGLFVLSSEYEGMPNALMEAMCLGLPVISTDCPCGGPRFLIKNNENGILVDVGNKEQLKEAILKIISNEDLAKKISKNAIKISTELSPEIINRRWKEFIIRFCK